MVRSEIGNTSIWRTGSREQLFNVALDPNEIQQRASDNPTVVDRLKALAIGALENKAGGCLRRGAHCAHFNTRSVPIGECTQFDRSRGVVGFSDRPEGALAQILPFFRGGSRLIYK